MVRMSIAPGPLEGSEVYDVDNEHVGTVQEAVTTGERITSFRVALDRKVAKKHHLRMNEIDVPRDYLVSTDGPRMDLGLSLDELVRRERG